MQLRKLLIATALSLGALASLALSVNAEASEKKRFYGKYCNMSDAREVDFGAIGANERKDIQIISDVSSDYYELTYIPGKSDGKWKTEGSESSLNNCLVGNYSEIYKNHGSSFMNMISKGFYPGANDKIQNKFKNLYYREYIHVKFSLNEPSSCHLSFVENLFNDEQQAVAVKIRTDGGDYKLIPGLNKTNNTGISDGSKTLLLDAKEYELMVIVKHSIPAKEICSDGKLQLSIVSKVDRLDMGNSIDNPLNLDDIGWNGETGWKTFTDDRFLGQNARYYHFSLDGKESKYSFRISRESSFSLWDKGYEIALYKKSKGEYKQFRLNKYPPRKLFSVVYHDLAKGDYILSVKNTNAFSQDQFYFTIQNGKVVKIDRPIIYSYKLNGNVINGSSINNSTVRGTVYDKDQKKIDEFEAICRGTNWSVRLKHKLQIGDSITAYAVQEDGKIRSETITVTVDGEDDESLEQLPAPPNPEAYSGGYFIKGFYSKNGARITVKEKRTGTSNTITVRNGEWVTGCSSPLKKGDTIKLYASKEGYRDSKVTSYVVGQPSDTADDQSDMRPTPSNTAVETPTINKPKVGDTKISGTVSDADEGRTVIVLIDGVKRKATVDSDGNWSLDVGNRVIKKSTEIVVYATDSMSSNRSTLNSISVSDKDSPKNTSKDKDKDDDEDDTSDSAEDRLEDIFSSSEPKDSDKDSKSDKNSKSDKDSKSDKNTSPSSPSSGSSSPSSGSSKPSSSSKDTTVSKETTTDDAKKQDEKKVDKPPKPTVADLIEGTTSIRGTGKSGLTILCTVNKAVFTTSVNSKGEWYITYMYGLKKGDDILVWARSSKADSDSVRATVKAKDTKTQEVKNTIDRNPSPRIDTITAGSSTIHGTGTPGLVIKCAVNNQNTSTALVGSNGIWTASSTVELKKGDSITAWAIAQNSKGQSTIVTTKVQAGTPTQSKQKGTTEKKNKVDKKEVSAEENQKKNSSELKKIEIDLTVDTIYVGDTKVAGTCSADATIEIERTSTSSATRTPVRANLRPSGIRYETSLSSPAMEGTIFVVTATRSSSDPKTIWVSTRKKSTVNKAPGSNMNDIILLSDIIKNKSKK